MLDRGDKQHDIAAYFGVNGGRVAEVATGSCDYPGAPAFPHEKLPPPGPYIGMRALSEVVAIIDDSIELIEKAGTITDEAAIALDALKTARVRALKG
jgi:hypothetical protein